MKRKRTNWIQVVFVIAALVLYALLMYSTRHVISYDTLTQKVWWDYLAKHNLHGITTINHSTANYTTIWYFFIYTIFIKTGLYANVPIEYLIKSIGIFFSLASSIVMFFIVKHFKNKSNYLPTVAAVITLFLPAFSMDVMKTNLSDSSYIFFALLSFLALVKDKKFFVWFFIGIGASFKLMAIYIVPVYIYLYFRNFKKSSLFDKFVPFIATALAIVLCSLPNVVAGGSFLNGIINPILTRTGGHIFAGGFSLWSIIYGMSLPSTPPQVKLFSIVLVTILLILTGLFIARYIRPEKRMATEYALFPIISTSLFYFFFPAQHESYIALAAVFAFIYLFLDFSILPIINFVAYTGIIAFAFYFVSLREAPGKSTFMFTWHYGTYYPGFTFAALIFLLIMIFSYFTLFFNSTFIVIKKNLE